MRPLVHFLTAPNLTLCGKSFWGISDSEGATPDLLLVNCTACLARLNTKVTAVGLDHKLSAKISATKVKAA